MIKSSLHFYTTVPLKRTHTDTQPQPTPSLWILKRVEMAVGRGFVEGIVSTLFKRVRKGAPLAKESTGLSLSPRKVLA